MITDDVSDGECFTAPTWPPRHWHGGTAMYSNDAQRSLGPHGTGTVALRCIRTTPSAVAAFEEALNNPGHALQPRKRSTQNRENHEILAVSDLEQHL